MDIDEIINFPIITRKINRAIQNEAESLNLRNIERSTIAYSNCASAGFGKLDEEINIVLSKLSKLQLKMRKISAIEHKITTYINDQYQSIISKSRTIAGDLDFDRYNYAELFEEKRSESISFAKYDLKLMKDSIISRRTAVAWDIGRILMGAVIGSALTYLVTIIK